MLLSKRVSVNRIIKGTWKSALFVMATCISALLVYDHFIVQYFTVPLMFPTILGTALSFFIGFGNNQAYDRWWEARKIWGALVNDSRTWARQAVHYIKDDELKRLLVKRHIAFLYALKQNLRKSDEEEYINYLNKEDAQRIQNESNKSNAILSLQNQTIDELYRANKIDGFRFQALNNMLVNFCDEMGKSERIKNTVFPTTYSYYTKLFIWVFIIGITLALHQTIGYWSILVGLFIGYIFLTTNKIGDTLVNPFEPLPAGVPISQIARTIEINILETLQEKDLPKPVESINNEYIL